MHGARLASGLTAVFGGMAALFVLLGAVASPVFFVVAALFGAVAYLTWYHSSGRLAERIYRTVEQQAATDGRRTRGGPRGDDPRGGGRRGPGGNRDAGAGPREEWRPPRDGQTAAEAAGRRRRAEAGARQRTNGTRQRTRSERTRPLERDYRVLGVEPGADEETITAAYRERVKEVHPDTDGGDEEQFKQVKEAYERLTGD